MRFQRQSGGDRGSAARPPCGPAVLGLQVEFLGEAACASVIPAEGAIATEEEIRESCRQSLARYKVPDRVHFVDGYSMTGTGKVRRAEWVRLLEEARPRPVA